MKKQAKVSVYPYPSVYGSHRSMVKQLDEVGVVGPLSAFKHPVLVTCIDEYGEYQTTLDRLDNGLADPNRCGERMIAKKEKRDNK